MSNGVDEVSTVASNRGRRTRSLGFWTALLLLLVLAAGIWSQSHVPSTDAAPDDVVQAYTHALSVYDCVTADRLTEGDNAWCGTRLTDVQVISSQPKRVSHDGVEVDGHHVFVRMTVHHGDMSMPDGPHVWGFDLARVGPDHSWRIVNQGLG